MVLVAAPGTASAAILLGTGVGIGGSKLSLGGASAAGGTAMGSLTAALGQLHMMPAESWGRSSVAWSAARSAATSVDAS